MPNAMYERVTTAPIETGGSRANQSNSYSCVLELPPFPQFLSRQRQNGGSRHGVGVGLYCRDQPLGRYESIKTLRFDRLPRPRLRRQIHPVPHRLEQPLLEYPQNRLDPPSRAQPRERLPIILEYLRYGIVPRRELQQQLVEVEPRHEAPRRQRRRALRALRPSELPRLPPRLKGEEQQPERLQHASESGFRPAHSACKQRQPPVIAHQHLKNPAGVAVRPVVQDVPRRQQDAAGMCAHQRLL